MSKHNRQQYASVSVQLTPEQKFVQISASPHEGQPVGDPEREAAHVAAVEPETLPASERERVTPVTVVELPRPVEPHAIPIPQRICACCSTPIPTEPDRPASWGVVIERRCANCGSGCFRATTGAFQGSDSIV
jgi:hypothetical protein